MVTRPIRALMIEDNPGDARLIQIALAEAEATDIVVERDERLADALARLSREDFDLVLLDLSLPDGHGIETFRLLRAEKPDIPVVVLSGLSDERVAVTAVNEGAQDYLVKGRVEPETLVRSIRYAIQRQGQMGKLRDIAHDDELTGLRNRRGFLTLGRPWLTDDGSKSPIVLLFIDVNGMKQINDLLGHKAGDAALVDVAGILRRTLRCSDLIARVGGDEFCALARVSDGETEEALVCRLSSAVDAFNRAEHRSYTVSISVGAVAYDPRRDRSLEELMSRGDELMYRQKKGVGAAPRLLVVDDDPVVRRLAHAMFESEYHVVTASDGEEACKLAGDGVGLILLDMALPDIHGTEVVRRLREDPATMRTPIIVMTGTGEATAEAECLRLGADDFVRKPFDPDVLRARVQSAFRRTAAR